MKSLVVYSSRTGNTKAVAEHIAAGLSDAVLCNAAHMPDSLEAFDLIFVGFWAYRRGADPEASRILQLIHGKRVAVFGTAGAYPDSESGKRYLENAASLLSEDCVYAGGFLCQGRVHSFHVSLESGVKNSGHEMTEERRARLTEAEKHPNAADFAAAVDFARRIEAGN